MWHTGICGLNCIFIYLSMHICNYTSVCQCALLQNMGKPPTCRNSLTIRQTRTRFWHFNHQVLLLFLCPPPLGIRSIKFNHVLTYVSMSVTVCPKFDYQSINQIPLTQNIWNLYISSGFIKERPSSISDLTAFSSLELCLLNLWKIAKLLI